MQSSMKHFIGKSSQIPAKDRLVCEFTENQSGLKQLKGVRMLFLSSRKKIILKPNDFFTCDD